jgi:hypothetical protein
MKKMICAALLSVFATGGVAFAHHSQAPYDEEHPIQLKGTVTSFLWANPHSVVYLDVKDQKGEVVHWTVETVNPGKLIRAGWTKDSIKTGDQVVLTLSPAKNGSHLGHFYDVYFADGKHLDIGEECLRCPGNPNFESAKQ